LTERFIFSLSWVPLRRSGVERPEALVAEGEDDDVALASASMSAAFVYAVAGFMLM
jgi:hypothetical protein